MAAPEEAGRRRRRIARHLLRVVAAGLMVFVGTLLGAFVNPLWLILPGFVGAGLAFAGITDTCGMAMVLAKMPWNRVKSDSSENTAKQGESEGEAT